jgi:hypothetical protein
MNTENFKKIFDLSNKSVFVQSEEFKKDSECFSLNNILHGVNNDITYGINNDLVQ